MKIQGAHHQRNGSCAQRATLAHTKTLCLTHAHRAKLRPVHRTSAWSLRNSTLIWKTYCTELLWDNSPFSWSCGISFLCCIKTTYSPQQCLFNPNHPSSCGPVQDLPHRSSLVQFLPSTRTCFDGELTHMYVRVQAHPIPHLIRNCKVPPSRERCKVTGFMSESRGSAPSD